MPLQKLKTGKNNESMFWNFALDRRSVVELQQWILHQQHLLIDNNNNRLVMQEKVNKQPEALRITKSIPVTQSNKQQNPLKTKNYGKRAVSSLHSVLVQRNAIV